MKRAWLALTDEYDDTSTVMIGANMAVARHVFDHIPGLDTELGPGAFVAGDDVLFSWQFQEAGFRVHRPGCRDRTSPARPPPHPRAAFLKRAVLEGRQEAYLFHHWLHGRTNWSMVKLWTRRAQLSAMRWVKWSSLRQEKGSPIGNFACSWPSVFMTSIATNAAEPGITPIADLRNSRPPPLNKFIRPHPFWRLSDMRVLLWMISSGNAIKGGHQTQIQETARHLEMLGVSTRIAYEHEPSLEGIDLVHNFGLDPTHIRRCWDHDLPVATSTIYWARDYVLGINNDASLYRTFMKRLRVAFVLARAAFKGQHPQKCEALIERQIRLRVIYEMSDVLLPNVQGEADDIYRELGVSTPYIVATNAVLPEKYHLPEKSVERKGVLSIGRVEPHKNQLGLIRHEGFEHPCRHSWFCPPPPHRLYGTMQTRSRPHLECHHGRSPQ